MTQHPYSNLLLPTLPANSNTKHTYHLLSERHLHALWFDQRYLKELKSSTGEAICVFSPGIWNSEAGPDFLKAHFKIGDQEFRGDVQIHFTDEHWYHDRHHLDEHYDQVVLHLSFWQSKHDLHLTNRRNHSLIKAYLEPFLAVSPGRLLYLIDLDLYPYKRFIGSGKCARSLFPFLSNERLIQLFRSAAEWRLIQKCTYLYQRANEPNDQFLAGLAMALGYKNNAEAFLEIFSWIKNFQQYREDEIISLCMLTCGFFDSFYQQKWADSKKYLQLQAIAQNATWANTPRRKLALNQIRPLNHPIRRFVVLAKLLASHHTQPLFDKMACLWSQNWSKCHQAKDWINLCSQLRQCLPSYEDPYWSHYYLFEETASSTPLTLLGEDLKNEILVNAFFPLLHGHVQQKALPQELEAFALFYSTLPAAKTSKSKYLAYRFFGETMNGTLLNRAEMEQGAYQVHRDFCLHFEGSCEGCPFVERYRSILPKSL